MAEGIQKPILGKLDQGTIFSCAMAEDYSGCDVFGLVITARCDVDRERAPVINYLPVVLMDDWIHRDGARILGQRARNGALGAIGKLLKQLGHAPSIMETEKLDAIFEKIVAPLPDKKHRREKQAFGEHASALRFLGSAPPKPDVPHTKELSTRFEPLAQGIATELTRQVLNGYYFLPQIETGGNSLGHVVLLREVRHIPRILSQRVASGLQQSDYRYLCENYAMLSERLSFGARDFSCPVGQLQSPRLEHLMQSFTLLFSRIGVDDPHPDHGKGSWHRQPSLQERT